VNEQEIVKRKIQLRGQHFQLRGIERIERIHKCIFLAIRKTLESQMTEIFDPVLSQKLDCINYLLEN